MPQAGWSEAVLVQLVCRPPVPCAAVHACSAIASQRHRHVPAAHPTHIAHLYLRLPDRCSRRGHRSRSASVVLPFIFGAAPGTRTVVLG